MGVEQDRSHSQSLSSFSDMGARKSGTLLTSPSPIPMRTVGRWTETSRTAGWPPRAMMTSSPFSAAAISSYSFAFASAMFICMGHLLS